MESLSDNQYSNVSTTHQPNPMILLIVIYVYYNFAHLTGCEQTEDVQPNTLFLHNALRDSDQIMYAQHFEKHLFSKYKIKVYSHFVFINMHLCYYLL